MKTYREIMLNNDENLGWCKPFKVEDKEIYWISNEEHIITVKIGNDEYIEVDDNVLNKLAKVVNPDYKKCQEDGWDIDDHLYHSDGRLEELPCRKCPWFDDCEAMDEEEY